MGFRVAGMSVTDPPDDRFVCELMTLLWNDRDYRLKNVWYLLDEVPCEQLLRCVECTLDAENLEARKGAVEVLVRLKNEEAQAKIREASRDDDPEFAAYALTKLNEVLRDEYSGFGSENLKLWKKHMGDDVRSVSEGIDENHVLTVVYRTLFLVDLQKKKTIWGHTCLTGICSVPVIRDGKVYFCCNDGSVFSVVVEDGSLVWNKPTDGKTDNVAENEVLVLNDRVVTTSGDNIWCLNRTDGALLWKTPFEQYMGELCFASGHIFAINGKELVKISPEGDVVHRVSLGKGRKCIASIADTVYVVCGYYIMAYDAGSMALIWKQWLGSGDSLPYIYVVENCDLLIVPVFGRTYCLRRSTGERIWSTMWDDSSPPVAVTGDMLLIDSHIRLEFRDLRTGELKYRYKEPSVYTGRRVCITGKTIASADMDGNLWLLKIPE
jgi:hypothetical protein